MTNNSTILVIAQNTFREAVRAHVLLTSLFAALALICIMLLFGMVTIGDQVRVLKDFGFLAMSLASVVYIAISGSTLLEKEIKKKTAFNVLSKAVHRWHFIVGKYLGLLLTSLTLLVLIWISVAILTVVLSGTFDPLLLTGLLYQGFEALLICGCVIFFSTIVVTPVLAGLFTVALYLAGRSSEYFLYFIDKDHTPVLSQYLLKALYYGVPNFAQINIANQITFGDPVPGINITLSAVYVVGYSVGLLLLSCVVFERRHFN